MPEWPNCRHHPPQPWLEASVVTTICDRMGMMDLPDQSYISLHHQCISSMTGWSSDTVSTQRPLLLFDASFIR